MSIMIREQWLLKLAKLMAPFIEKRTGQPMPLYRVTCGFPSSGGMKGRKTRVRGQCWSAEASKDNHAEIFISPVEDEVDVVTAILAHEMIHATLPKAGHSRTFQRSARLIGHKAPFTTATPTEEFWSWVRPLLAQLPEYPHGRLNAVAPVAARRPQKNRQIKCVCVKCGYIARASRSWIERTGPPHCPAHGAMVVETPSDEADMVTPLPQVRLVTSS